MGFVTRQSAYRHAFPESGFSQGISTLHPNPQGFVAFLPFVRTKLKSLITRSYDFEPNTLGQHLLKRRLVLNLTQKDVGKLFNVCSLTVSNWEIGHSEPQIFHVPTLIKFLGYDPINPAPTSIAEHLKSKHRKFGWSQKIAAKKLGVDPCTWSSWECGGTIMTHKHRRLIASFLGIDEKTLSETMRKQWNERHGKSRCEL